MGLHRQLIKGFPFELNVDPVGFEVFLFPKDDGVVRIFQDGIEIVNLQFLKNGGHRKPSDKFRLESIGDEIFGFTSLRYSALSSFERISAPKPIPLGSNVSDDLLQTIEGSTHDEEDVFSIDRPFLPFSGPPIVLDGLN
jgi:hypothetical protein